MARIKDLWYTTGARGPKHKTDRHPDCSGDPDAKRWLAVWAGPDRRECTKAFARRIDAEQFLRIKEKTKLRSELLAADGDGLDPGGFYVYLLWEVENDTAPVYVGSSGNILSRLGAHLGDNSKRARVGWVTLIRCTAGKAMLRRETELIRKYRPEWNKVVMHDGKLERLHPVTAVPPEGGVAAAS